MIRTEKLMRAIMTCACLVLASSLHATEPPRITLAQALASQAGRWEGKLEYRDYQADEWFGLPVAVEVRDGGDGVTLVRVADFDDGPRVGNVRITTVTMLGKDGETEWTGTFRKGRDAELTSAKLFLSAARDATHWTIVSDALASDDDRPARVRYTTTRDGDSLVSLKEIDFADDTGEAWLQRNRETLRRVGG